MARGISASKTVVSGYPTFVSRKLTLVYYLLPFCFCFLLLELLTLASLILIDEIQGYPVGMHYIPLGEIRKWKFTTRKHNLDIPGLFWAMQFRKKLFYVRLKQMKISKVWNYKGNQ